MIERAASTSGLSGRGRIVVLGVTALVTLGVGAGASGTVAAKPWVPPKAPTATTATAAPTTTRPSSAPAGATFQCRDGTYSFVRSQSAACWGHGGVLRRV